MYNVSKGKRNNEGVYEWKLVESFKTYEEAKAKARELCTGKEIDVEPYRELEEGFFGNSELPDWEARILQV